MPYRRRYSGLSVGEMFEMKSIISFIREIQAVCIEIPFGLLRNAIVYVAFGLYIFVLARILVERDDSAPINHRNKNRLINSFTDEECWNHLRFRRAEFSELFVLCEFPAVVVCSNGTTCPGEHAFCLILYRISYPSRSIELQDVFGRDYSQLPRIFKWSIDFMYTKHKHKVMGNLPWYSDRFDLNHQVISAKIINSARNPNRGFIPMEVSNIFGFLDGTGLEIARPSNGVQNPFWNGYMHGHYLIFQRISFPDGMLVIEGAFPGYQPDTMVWRDSLMREELDAIMIERVAEGKPRFKLYANKIYSNSVLVTAS